MRQSALSMDLSKSCPTFLMSRFIQPSILRSSIFYYPLFWCTHADIKRKVFLQSLLSVSVSSRHFQDWPIINVWDHLPTHITCGQLATCRWRPPGHRQTSALTNWLADSSETNGCPLPSPASPAMNRAMQSVTQRPLPIPAYYIIARDQSRGLPPTGWAEVGHFIVPPFTQPRA